MDGQSKWFDEFRQSPQFAFLQKKPLAYFCAEYALADSLPTYAGGLGVLAGDFIKELYDQRIPAVAVGLCYKEPYHRDKNAQSVPELTNLQDAGLQPVLDSDNKPILLQVPIQDHEVIVKAWQWQKNTIPVYLLDTDVEKNNAADRSITRKLYASDKETRLKQEIILGIGGYRLLEKLTVTPSLYHMNEGHSALLALEIARSEMQQHKTGFHDAVLHASHHIIFTNHTLVPAGSEIFHSDLFTYLLSRYASQLEIPVSDILALGQITETRTFSLSLFALRLAGKINAVSGLHARNAGKMWSDYSIESVTNGIYVPTWDKSCKEDLLVAHQSNKKQLLELIRSATGKIWGEKQLLIGWARRMVRYKRPLALFGEADRLLEICTNSDKPVRIIIAGIPHQADDEGIQILTTIRELINAKLSGIAVYLPGYNIGIAQALTAGCDIWLNTPVVGSEACGTSGMKAALNGCLPLTTNDGWVNEVDLSNIGWLLDNDAVHDDLLRILENEIIPDYFEETDNWRIRMQNARSLILNNYSSTRMLKEYIEKIYLPVISASYTH